MTAEPLAPYLEPVRKTRNVRLGPAAAFELFTAGLGRWWPLAAHSIGQGRTREVVFEPREGGEVSEILTDGTRCPWGRVLIYEPPRRFVMTWHPGRPADTAQELEVRFTAEGDGTRVELEHRNWQALGAEARAARGGYDGGWEGVLDAFLAAANKGPDRR